PKRHRRGTEAHRRLVPVRVQADRRARSLWDPGGVHCPAPTIAGARVRPALSRSRNRCRSVDQVVLRDSEAGTRKGSCGRLHNAPPVKVPNRIPRLSFPEVRAAHLRRDRPRSVEGREWKDHVGWTKVTTNDALERTLRHDPPPAPSAVRENALAVAARAA